MSPEEDKRANKWLTGSALRQELLHYIPPELLAGVDWEALGFKSTEFLMDIAAVTVVLERLIESRFELLKMYKPANELAEKLEIYRKCSSIHTRFKMSMSDPYNHSIYFYEPGYYVRQDLYVRLQSHIFEFLPDTTKPLAYQLAAIYLKGQELKIAHTFQLVKNKRDYGGNPMLFASEKTRREAMYEWVKCLRKDEPAKRAKNRKKIQNYINKSEIFNYGESLEDAIRNWKKVLKEDEWINIRFEPEEDRLKLETRDPPSTCIADILTAHWKQEESFAYAEIVYTVMNTIEMIDEAINSRPDIYAEDKSQEKQESYPIRVLVDGRNEFILHTELLEIIQRHYSAEEFDNMIDLMRKRKDGEAAITKPYGVMYKPDNESVHHAYMMNELEYDKHYRFDFYLDYVYIPVHKMKQMTPVLMRGQKFCVFMRDALMNTMRRVTLGRKFFQKMFNTKDFDEDGYGMRNMVHVENAFNLYFADYKVIRDLKNFRALTLLASVDKFNEYLDCNYSFKEFDEDEYDVLIPGEMVTEGQAYSKIKQWIPGGAFVKRDEIFKEKVKKAKRQFGKDAAWPCEFFYDIYVECQMECLFVVFSRLRDFYDEQAEYEIQPPPKYVTQQKDVTKKEKPKRR